MGIATEPLPLRIHRFKEESMIESNCKHCGGLIKRYGKKPGVFCGNSCKAEFEKAPWDVQKAIELYESGKSYEDIAIILSVSRETLRKELVRQGFGRSRTDWLSTDRNPTKGKPRSSKTKKKLSKAAKKQFSNPKAREHLSKLMIDRIASGKVVRTSKLEDFLACKLDELGIDYERQVSFRDDKGRFLAVVDFKFNDMLVEVNGTFWHCDPREYPNGPEYECQRRALNKHSKKLEYLKSKGHVVHELWEIDINQDVDSVLLQLLEKENYNDS